MLENTVSPQGLLSWGLADRLPQSVTLKVLPNICKDSLAQEHKQMCSLYFSVYTYTPRVLNES